MRQSVKEVTETAIMIVDDTPENLRVLSSALAGRGYRVLAFPSGELALRAMLTQLPDLLLLDINMPGMNGFQVAERMQTDTTLRQVPILFISAMQDTEAKI